MENVMGGKDLEWLTEWTFRKRHNYLSAHNIHRYPATFVPEIAAKLIQAFSKPDDVVLDIFSGSGTTMLEAKRLQRYGVGIEMNPLAELITKVKTCYIPDAIIGEEFAAWRSAFLSKKFESHTIQNADFWFHPTTNDTLSSALGALSVLDNKDAVDFLKICLSEIVREVSYCVHSGFKLHRDKKKISEGRAFDKKAFLDKLNPVIKRNRAAIAELEYLSSSSHPIKVYLQDAKEKSGDIKDGSVDLIITSPPYGDSITTVAYGQFSAFSSEMLQMETAKGSVPRQLDNELLGGIRAHIDIEEPFLPSLTVRNVQELMLGRVLMAQDNKERLRSKNRLKDILSFYIDLDCCIANAADYLKDDGFFILITASRIVHDVKLHTDNIITEMAGQYGLVLKNIYYRDILCKRMPAHVNAKNKKGSKSATMTNESIIVLQKQL